MDAYPTDNGLSIIEVNAAFVDGWGTALNLSRAIGERLDTNGVFPDRFSSLENQYLPELKLLIGELALRGQMDARLADQGEETRPIYVYGRVMDIEDDTILPLKGLALDNKQWLTGFSDTWNGQMVRTPPSYSIAKECEWSDVPDDVYIKFTDKSSEESQKARFSVKQGKPQGKSPFLKRSYNEGKLIAQSRVPEFRTNLAGIERSVQLVILNKGNFLTGYVQYASGYIINDDSVHGPLKFENTEQG